MDPEGTALVVSGIAIDLEGRIIGYGMSPPTGHSFVFRLLFNGEPDDTFGDGGLCQLPTISDEGSDFPAAGVFISSSGIIVVGNALVDEGGSGLRYYMPAATRILANGSLDLDFGGSGNGVAIYLLPIGAIRPPYGGWPPATGRNLAFNHPSGGAYFATDIWDSRKISRHSSYLIKIDDSGSLDANFGDGGYVEIATQGINILGLEVDRESQILASGHSGAQIGVVDRFLPRGGKDGAFIGWILAGNSKANCKQIKRLYDDKYLALVQLAFFIADSKTESALMRFDYWGRPDPEFNGGQLLKSELLPQVCTTLAVDAGSRSVVAGSRILEQVPPALVIARLLPNGIFDEAFGEQGRVVNEDYFGCPAAVIQGDVNIVFVAEDFSGSVIGRLVG
ncbi:hypothetical protein [Luteibacter sp. SG786]|uniref:hypothetical protein n=1 Tax=Luteibacter sp. SG786 TaxID=2587130 RepID=UPI00141EF0B3|nr:hypothetical protein [Luteibacter sp. SG786]NII53203.1 hypothetical protein [Luteibacter sp. SG786]